MNVTPGSYHSYAHRSAQENLALTHNRQKQIEAQNAKTGGHYDLQKEISATNAQSVLSLLV